MRHAAKEPHSCPFGELLEILARPWTMHVLWVLTERLRVLEQKGFVFRDYKPTIPPSVTYGITKRMKDISKVMGDLDELARKWQQEDAHLRTKPEGGKVRAQRADVREGAHA